MAEQQPTVPSRRLVLGGSAAAALSGALVGFGAGRLDAPASAAEPAQEPAEAAALNPYGAYQRGILEEPQTHGIFLGLDIRWPKAKDERRDRLRSLLRMLGEDAARLMSGDGVLADSEPEMASARGRLSITVGLSRDAAAQAKSTADLSMLEPLPEFSGDKLEPRFGQADLLVQFCGDDPTALAHALRAVRKNLTGLATVRFEQHGFTTPPGQAEHPHAFRNLFGQLDGIANPRTTAREGAVFGHGDEQSWLPGGTVLVLRRIRMDLERWDEVDRPGRDFALGRRQSDGSPLSGQHPDDPVDLSAITELGLPAIAGNAHVALAKPVQAAETMWRRGFSYTDGGESGLLFACFQRDARTAFVPVQRRLAASDAMNQWITHTGSGIYGILPGMSQEAQLGAALFAE
ncbi:Dyp-type peroxidase [Glutamicibacter endophyticus]